jgi:[NiFe] hydrogenase diaphorase moiety small subunit
MSDTIKFTIDGVEIEALPGQTIMEAADNAGIYIPRLCAHNDLLPFGGCRVCTVMVNDRPQTACTQPVLPGMSVENDTEELRRIRTSIVEMLFVEGNHYCPFCEKSGNCELQALGYRLGMLAPEYPYMFNEHDIDASHPDIFIDHNRCILCGRCVRSSKELDGKNVFQFVGRGIHKKVAFNSDAGLSETNVSVTDKAIENCPVGAIIRKRTGYTVPIGKRKYDSQPIGSDIESRRAAVK